ncbi:MAG: hypothetical protein COC06_02145 [Bacteroidales bacterium]|nr:hypothetical protein [Labilibaculum sp.]PCH71208.1 MAG: hypothetical protein COC06_02145 [Bacteroidales bacterium]
MISKLIIFSSLYFCFNVLNIEKQLPVKVWIDIEGELPNLSLKAMLLNNGDKDLSLSYVLKITKKGRLGESNSLQKGAFIAAQNKITSLSESRMNLRKGDKLIARLLVYHDKIIVAQDSVVFHGDNY